MERKKVTSLSRVRLCDPMDCSLPHSSVHGIFQARVLEWVVISFSRGSSRPRNRTQVSRIAGRRRQSRDCEVTSVTSDSVRPHRRQPTSSAVPGILQARVLEWVAISFSRGSSRPRDPTQVSRIAGRRFNL